MTMTMTTTTDLVPGMRLEAPVRGDVVSVQDIGDGYLLLHYLTLAGPKVYKTWDTQEWELTPEHTLAWEPYEMYVLRDGDSWVFLEVDIPGTGPAADEAARAWAAAHYPAARYQVGGVA